MTTGWRKIEVEPRAQIMLVTFSLGFVKTRSHWRGRTATAREEEALENKKQDSPCFKALQIMREANFIKQGGGEGRFWRQVREIWAEKTVGSQTRELPLLY
jgi:hypothetical protein